MKTVHFFLFCLLAIGLQSCQSQSASGADGKNIATIKQAYDHLNQRNFDGFAALCDGENYVEVNVAPTPTKGVNNAIALYKQFTEGFPDFKLDITDIAPAGNNRYLLRLNVTGTHTGTFMGIPPTGKPIKWTDADVVTVNPAGKITSHEVTNVGQVMVQLGQASMMNPVTQTAMQVYEKFGQADIPGVLALCDDKVVFQIEDRMFDSKPRTFTGKAEVGKFFEELNTIGKYSKFQPTRFVADGNDVFVILETEYEHLPTKKKYASTYTHQFKVVNGKVTYFKGLDGFAKAL